MMVNKVINFLSIFSQYFAQNFCQCTNTYSFQACVASACHLLEALSGIARLFADDTSLIFSSADPAEIERILNLDLSKLSAGAKIWLVIFNATKTEVMKTSNIFFLITIYDLAWII